MNFNFYYEWLVNEFDNQVAKGGGKTSFKS